MPYIIGTAGHIDHGKTALIKALTGQDTDRLKEEKERGISIDLGFAYLDLPDGTRAGIVDVPGHERFIRNMLAGAHAIDLVLLTVAADDGVMPQTEEHLDILHLLGVRQGVVVLTKADLASEARLAEVTDEIHILTAGTALEDAPVVPVSSVTGQGLDRLRAEIVRALEAGQKPQPTGYFRLPVDRAFLLQGHGLVVTGTALAGTVGVGQRVRRLPHGDLLRVRSIEVHGQAVETAAWGQRVALNLAGQDGPAPERGDVVCDECIRSSSVRFDAWIEIRPTAARGIASHQRVRLHLGTAERLAKIVLLGSAGTRLGPKGSGYCQVVLAEPVLALRGDRFILRDETAQRTLGGGVVVHPWAGRHKKGEADLERRLATLHRSDLARLVETYLEGERDFAVPMSRLLQFLNLTEEEAAGNLLDGCLRAFHFEGDTLYTTGERFRRVERAVQDLLETFHVAHPLAAGMDLEAARVAVPGDLSSRVFRSVVSQLEDDGGIAREGSLLRLPGHEVRLPDEQRALAGRILSLLGASPMAPPDLTQIGITLAVEQARLLDVLRVMERERSIVRVTPALCFRSEDLTRAKNDLYRRFPAGSEITPATFKELFGISRKYAIPLLEYFDREGVTRRLGDVRRVSAARREAGTPG
jgi:selenocysteine-specific elongation factor